MGFIVSCACGSAPAYGSTDVTSAHAYPALIPHRALRDSGTELGYRYVSPVGAPPQQANAGLPGTPALDSGRGWCFVAPGCIFERVTEIWRKSDADLVGLSRCCRIAFDINNQKQTIPLHPAWNCDVDIAF
jgi:hypothetical protein